MKKLVVLGLALISLLGAGFANAAWNAEWKQRVKLGLNTSPDGLAMAAPVDGAPLLVRLHTGNFQFVEAKPDGSDLRFIAGDDKTPLKFHIEKFDGLNELALVWVQLPKLLPGVKTESIWLYYGNPNAPPAGDAKTMYDAAQALVYHFGEREPLPQDATANVNHAVSSSAKASAAGVIGGGLAFDGTGELVLPAAPSLKASANGLTVSLWLKPIDGADVPVFSLGEGANALRLAVRGGKLVAQAGSLTATAAAAVAPATWQHVAVVVKDGLTLYINGQESARAAGAAPDIGARGSVGKGFKGEIDEFQLASTARSADWLKLAALSQGQDPKLIAYGAAEGGGAEEAGPSHMRILFAALTVDGWVVVGICILMSIVSIWVMITKAVFVERAAKDNDRFKSSFQKLIEAIQPTGDDTQARQAEKEAAARYGNSQLFRLYAAGVYELRGRFASYAKAGKPPVLSGASLEAIRATIDARLVRETQRLNSKMVLLTISIAGGPFLGLLGTVVGVMITFAAIAAAGDVNVNSIAPGIAAALIATVAGLGVAIPALFGYNYLTGRVQSIVSDMHVFVDELVTRFAENHSE